MCKIVKKKINKNCCMFPDDLLFTADQLYLNIALAFHVQQLLNSFSTTIKYKLFILK